MSKQAEIQSNNIPKVAIDMIKAYKRKREPAPGDSKHLTVKKFTTQLRCERD
jgi:hypothetical protein